jgi:hypothetical protein
MQGPIIPQSTTEMLDRDSDAAQPSNAIVNSAKAWQDRLLQVRFRR